MVSLSLSSFFYFSSSFPFSSVKNGEMKWIETIASEHETTNRRSRQNLFATIESKNSSTELSEHHRIRGFADFETSNLQNVWSGCLARLELSFESALSTALCIQRPRSDGKNKMTRIVAVWMYAPRCKYKKSGCPFFVAVSADVFSKVGHTAKKMHLSGNISLLFFPKPGLLLLFWGEA